MRPARHLGATWFFACSLAGCHDRGTPYCEETAHVLALDEASPIQMSGADVLGLAAGAHVLPLVWVERCGDAAFVDVGAPEKQTTVTLTVTYTGGEVRYVDSVLRVPPGPTYEIGVSCMPRVEVDVQLEAITADGLLNESWQKVTLAREATDSFVVFSHDVEPSSFRGALEIESVDPPNPTDINYEISGIFPAGDEPSGRFGGSVVYRNTLGVFDIAIWGMEPNDRCN